jgi:hypothetical protein
MKQKQSVIIDNIYLNLDRYTYESDEMFYFRVNYIINNIKENIEKNIFDKIDLFEIIGLSMIEMNKFFNKSVY